MLTEYRHKIDNATVYDVAIKTPLDAMPQLSMRLGNTVLLKREDLQPVFSFKLRGAYNRMSQLTAVQRQAGVVAASAGNHAQGVALSAQKLGIDALIVMPITTPPIKVDAVTRLGAEVLLEGNGYDEACTKAVTIAEEKGFTFIHPYDDPDVIAGQGTIGKEILAQHPESLDYIFVPVGGGGLISGIAAYIKAVRPEIKIIGVESDDSASLQVALAAGERLVLKQVGAFADGTAVKQVGVEPFRIARETVDDVITVSSDELCAAIMTIFEDTRAIAEPSGALAVAGAIKYCAKQQLKDKTIVAINSGANINFDRLRHVAERAEIGGRKEVLFATTIAEEPGSFQQFCELLSKQNITEFNYRYADNGTAHVFVGVRITGGDTERTALLASLEAADYQSVDLTDNRIARNHVRYMVGGHAPHVENEQLYHFTFPERPGALLRFLTRIGSRWNISLFHYRNHGSAYGRVLVGVQVNDIEMTAFQSFLSELGYSYERETENPAYQLFLK